MTIEVKPGVFITDTMTKIALLEDINLSVKFSNFKHHSLYWVVSVTADPISSKFGIGNVIALYMLCWNFAQYLIVTLWIETMML